MWPWLPRFGCDGACPGGASTALAELVGPARLDHIAGVSQAAIRLDRENRITSADIIGDQDEFSGCMDADEAGPAPPESTVFSFRRAPLFGIDRIGGDRTAFARAIGVDLVCRVEKLVVGRQGKPARRTILCHQLEARKRAGGIIDIHHINAFTIAVGVGVADPPDRAYRSRYRRARHKRGRQTGRPGLRQLRWCEETSPAFPF